MVAASGEKRGASPGERWYDIPGYRKRYQVSTRGRVRSLARVDDGGHHRSTKLRSTQTRVGGRRHVVLCRKGVPRSFCVSVLMARAYRIPKPNGCDFVVHRNGDYRDFRRSNLEWVTLAGLRMHDGSKTSSRYYGVSRLDRSQGMYRWLAALRVAGRRREIGLFPTETEAAYAYDQEVGRLSLNRPVNGLAKPRPHRVVIKSLPGEIWRPFPGAKRTHMISNKGRVRTVEYVARRGQRVAPKLRKVTVSATGYRSVAIGQRRYSIRTIAERVFG